MRQDRIGRTWRWTGTVGVGCLLVGALAPVAAGHPAPDDVGGPRGGRVVVWGGPEELREVLTPPVGLDDVVAVAASDTSGSFSNLALRADGTVVGWGLDAFGEATPPADLSDVVAVDTGAGFSVALRADGTVVTWGTNESGQLDVPADLGPVTAVSAGGYRSYRGLGVPEGVCGFALALRADGTVVRWGRDTPDLGCPLLDARLDPPADLDEVVAVSAGSTQAVALRSDGTVVAWGSGVTGRDGTPPDRWTDVVAVSAGTGTTLGLRSDGTVHAYGIWGESGPPQVSDVAALSASQRDVFLHRDGRISAYRDTFPSSVPAGTAYTAVAAGYDYGLAIEVGVEEPPPLLGWSGVQPWVDSNPSGTAEAFVYRAAGTGPVSTAHVYLDESNEADEVHVGLYSDEGGEPGTLLAEGRSTDVTDGAWNAVALGAVELVEGQEYWLALLSPVGSGVIRFRDLVDGDGGRTRLGAETSLTGTCGLPTTWTTGREFANSPASIYLD